MPGVRAGPGIKQVAETQASAQTLKDHGQHGPPSQARPGHREASQAWDPATGSPPAEDRTEPPRGPRPSTWLLLSQM